MSNLNSQTPEDIAMLPGVKRKIRDVIMSMIMSQIPDEVSKSIQANIVDRAMDQIGGVLSDYRKAIVKCAADQVSQAVTSITEEQ